MVLLLWAFGVGVSLGVGVVCLKKLSYIEKELDFCLEFLKTTCLLGALLAWGFYQLAACVFFCRFKLDPCLHVLTREKAAAAAAADSRVALASVFRLLALKRAVEDAVAGEWLAGLLLLPPLLLQLPLRLKPVAFATSPALPANII